MELIVSMLKFEFWQSGDDGVPRSDRVPTCRESGVSWGRRGWGARGGGAGRAGGPAAASGARRRDRGGQPRRPMEILTSIYALLSGGVRRNPPHQQDQGVNPKIDSVAFRLHCGATTAALLAASAALTTRHLVGNPIDCIHTRDIPEDVLNTYCWIHSTFTVAGEAMGGAYPGVRSAGTSPRRYGKYYQWVAFTLFFQLDACDVPSAAVLQARCAAVSCTHLLMWVGPTRRVNMTYDGAARRYSWIWREDACPNDVGARAAISERICSDLAHTFFNATRVLICAETRATVRNPAKIFDHFTLSFFGLDVLGGAKVGPVAPQRTTGITGTVDHHESRSRRTPQRLITARNRRSKIKRRIRNRSVAKVNEGIKSARRISTRRSQAECVGTPTGKELAKNSQ
ncbi:unnamed protein product, partial [Iphiclides podalirius]